MKKNKHACLHILLSPLRCARWPRPGRYPLAPLADTLAIISWGYLFRFLARWAQRIGCFFLISRFMMATHDTTHVFKAACILRCKRWPRNEPTPSRLAEQGDKRPPHNLSLGCTSDLLKHIGKTCYPHTRPGTDGGPQGLYQIGCFLSSLAS